MPVPPAEGTGLGPANVNMAGPGRRRRPAAAGPLTAGAVADGGPDAPGEEEGAAAISRPPRTLGFYPAV